MSSSARRPHSGLDRLAAAEGAAGEGEVAPPEPGSDAPETALADAASTDGGLGDWGVTAMPSWLDPVAPEDRSSAQRTVGDRFGEPVDEDADTGRRRIAVAPPAAVALILAGVLACVIAAFAVLRSPSEDAPAVAFPASAGPGAIAATAPRDTGASTGASAAASSTESLTELVVSVVGLVHKPGLVRLPAQSRVADAIARAGGARAGADMLSLNLAQKVNDGDQILVGYAGGPGRMTLRSAVVTAAGGSVGGPDATAGTSGPSPSGSNTTGSGQSGSATGKVNLNTATEAQLDALPGVGPVTAKAILAWRDQHGRFTSVDQLGEVDGIGPARLARLRDQVTV
ncbi:ComEA family DNA-binding protein [Gordonia sp. CPCC 205515]|uniref:ComEA family DNA-binding protein n=1 Tax=Gordonia sp. CPCC 205515 TaxID=3140791 RepID=UPI003AF3CFC4